MPYNEPRGGVRTRHGPLWAEREITMKARQLLVYAATALVVVPGLVLAQEAADTKGEELAPDEGVRRMVVKRYTTLGPEAVYRAVNSNVLADVRFSDEFDGPVRLTGALRFIRIGDRRETVGAAFSTQSRLCCLVPLEAKEQMEKLRELAKGQTITVEGTVAGIVAAAKCVLVDRVLTGAEKQSDIHHELLLEWPGVAAARPKIIVEPGEYESKFPCRWQAGQFETAVVLVEETSRMGFLEELRRLEEAARELAEEGEEEGKKAPAVKVYNLYRPEAVYEHARNDNQLDVRFQDRVKGPTPPSPNLAQVRLRGQAPVRIGYAFETYMRITCLVPRENEDLLDRAKRMMRGQEVLVKGTVLGQVGAHRAVLVDELELPSVKGEVETPDVWVIKIFWGKAKPLMLWQPGTYTRDLPCQFVDRRTERLQITLQEVRYIGGKKEGEEGEEE